MTDLRRGKKKWCLGLERFKFEHADRAYHLFGRAANEVTEGQWLYIFMMLDAIDEAKPGKGRPARKIKQKKVLRPKR